MSQEEVNETKIEFIRGAPAADSGYYLVRTRFSVTRPITQLWWLMAGGTVLLWWLSPPEKRFAWQTLGGMWMVVTFQWLATWYYFRRRNPSMLKTQVTRTLVTPQGLHRADC